MTSPVASRDVARHRVTLKSPTREALRRLVRKPQALLGAALIAIVVLGAVLAPTLAPFAPNRQGVGDPLVHPSRTHLFGTDQFGRDVFSRVLHGGRVSLQLGLISVAIGGSFGLLIGAVAGYFGGHVEEIAMRFVDIMLAFPGILLALAIVILLGPGIQNLMIAVGIGAIPTIARVVRGSVLDVKSRDYIAAARVLGVSDRLILQRHILPNVMAPFIVLVTLDVATAILAGTSLSFLGIGVKPPSSEWGLMLTDARNFLRDAWWVGMFPGLAITVTVVGINLLGDGLRDALDPRLRGSR